MPRDFVKGGFNRSEVETNLGFFGDSKINEMIAQIADLKEIKSSYNNPSDYATYVVGEFLNCTKTLNRSDVRECYPEKIQGEWKKLLPLKVKNILANYASEKIAEFEKNTNSHYQNLAGAFYLYGIGVEQNLDKAHELFSHAKASNSIMADCYLGVYFAETEKDNFGFSIEEIEEIKKSKIAAYSSAAERGFTPAFYHLGKCYADINSHQSYQNFRQAFLRGYLPAVYELARCCYDAIGVEKDDAEAFKLLISACKNGDENAVDFIGKYAMISGYKFNPQPQHLKKTLLTADEIVDAIHVLNSFESTAKRINYSGSKFLDKFIDADPTRSKEDLMKIAVVCPLQSKRTKPLVVKKMAVREMNQSEDNYL